MKSRPTSERIAVISDGTCETAENYVRAILALFNKSHIELSRFPRVRQEGELIRTLDQLTPPFLVVYTFATEQLRKTIWSEIKKRGLRGYDILYPALPLFAEFLESTPTEKQGNLHTVEAVNYFDRMEAVEYTVKHDDGLRMGDLQDANIILTGVSRTSKTPTSMYLAHRGYRVANVPLVPGVEPSGTIIQAHDAGVSVILLTIEAGALERIRRSRFRRLGTAPNHSDTYVDLKTIVEELEAAHQLARRHKWPIIDVTNKAVEETASEILLLVDSKER